MKYGALRPEFDRGYLPFALHELKMDSDFKQIKQGFWAVK